MSTEIRIKFISDGFKEILNSPGVHSVVTAATDKIAVEAAQNADGGGFTSKTWTGNYGGGRWVGSVITADEAARKAEAENKVLSKAVHV